MSDEKKVLIVDDEAHIRLLIQQTLEDLEDQGIELLIAKNGSEALKIVQEQKPQLIFLDVMMPNISGLDVCRTIKYEFDFKEVYIVILTAKGQQYDREKSKQAGADQYITKPFDPDEILELATSVLMT